MVTANYKHMDMNAQFSLTAASTDNIPWAMSTQLTNCGSYKQAYQGVFIHRRSCCILSDQLNKPKYCIKWIGAYTEKQKHG